MLNLVTAIVLAATAAFPYLEGTQSALAAQSDRSIEETTFYRVPLMCHAARGLGCGSRAKPVLLDLQKRPIVEEAWLNQTGEILAVVWTHGSDAAARSSTIRAVTEAHDVSMAELDTNARDAALKSFRSGTGWHRGTDVDRLSEQEAQVISDRLLHRVTAKAPTAQVKVSVVGPVLTEAIRQQLVSTCTSPTRCREALLAAASKHFDKSELAALQDAIALGFQPVGDER